MNEAGYPKWVQRAPDIGPVLCLTADEEKQLLDDWQAEKAASASAAADAAKAAAAEAEAAAQVALKGAKGK